jgi:hypothetical protein
MPKIENMVGKWKDCHPIDARYYRCAHTSFSSIPIAYFFLFYLKI